MSTGSLASYVASKKAAAPLTFDSQREFDSYLRGQVANNILTPQEATTLRDTYSGPAAKDNGTVIRSSSTPVVTTGTIGNKTAASGSQSTVNKKTKAK